MSETLARLIEEPVGREFVFGPYCITRQGPEHSSEEIFRFRFKEFLGAGFIASRAFPDKMLRDEFDAVAIQIAAYDENDGLVGTTRFVPHTPIGFLTERLFSFDMPPQVSRTRLGELGRLAISRAHRGGNRMVMIGMLKAAFECMIEFESSHVVAFLSPDLAHSFATLGCKAMAVNARRPDSTVLGNRESMAPYFDSQQAMPFVYDLESMIENVGVRRRLIEPRLGNPSAAR